MSGGLAGQSRRFTANADPDHRARRSTACRLARGVCVCVRARCVLSLRAHVGGRPLIKRTHTSCDPSAIAGGQPAVERQKQHRYSILRPPTRGRCGSIAILCASPPALVAPCRCAPSVMPTTRAILEDDGCVAPWWLSLCVMR
jgi:hypothetical protein